MKHLKTYETINDDYSKLPIKELKTYILLTKNIDNDDVSIFKIKHINYVNYLFNVYKLYDISDTKVKKINIQEKVEGFSVRFTFIIKHLISHSDNLDELIEIGKLYTSTKKYNL